MPAETPDDRLSTLRASYEELRRERDRIRDARGWASRQLGPLPSAAGVTTGIVATFSGHLHHGWLWAAIGGLAAMIVISVAYSQVPSYRQMLAAQLPEWDEQVDKAHPGLRDQARALGLSAEDLLPERDWLTINIGRERSLYGPVDRKRNRYGLPRWNPADLQDAFDRERTGMFAVQLLFVAVIACLVLARLT